MCKWSCICVYDCMHIAIILLYQDRIYIQAAESCNSPNLFNLENQRLLFERLKLNGWMLFQVAVAQGFMYLVSRHQHSSCMMWLLPNQHLTIRLMMVEMVNICTHSINSNMWMLGIVSESITHFAQESNKQLCLPAHMERDLPRCRPAIVQKPQDRPVKLGPLIFTILPYRFRKPVEQMMQ